MIFFIDSAGLNEIRELNDLGIINGVTTNPSLMAKEGINDENSILEHYQKICNIVTGDVSAEVISTEYKDIIEYEHDLFKCALDDEISTIVDDIKKVDDMDDKDASRALKMKLGKVINNLYNSNLDITEDTYKTFNEFLSKFG